MRGVKVEDPTERAMHRGYTNQRSRAIGRGIAFEFTFEEWRQWWLTDDRWSNRGKRKGQFVMARRGDQGAYSPDNVFCTTPDGNYRDMPEAKRQATIANAAIATKRRWQDPLAHVVMRRGARHPRSRPVKTQVGVFANATRAAEAFEITRQHAARLARERLEGWECGWRADYVKALLKKSGDVVVLRMYRRAMTAKPGGDRQSKHAKSINNNVMNALQGNALDYTLDRLERERGDLYEKVTYI